MTIQRLRFRLRKLRALGEELHEESGELNLVPYLDIIMNIIMFLLATVTFSATLTSINVNLPTALTAAASPTEAPPKQELNLTVSVTEKGFTIATSGAVLFRGFRLESPGPGQTSVVQTTSELPTLPLVAGQPDLAGLSRALVQIKAHYPGEERAIITASPQIPYELLVHTMDAMRSAEGKVLFPSVLLGAGVN
ncbi:MAG TPA: biopolymer transporter ExbD [Pseudomonadota bacterium]|nr:biopolymer transporter ExbD [Pseudomonadota bacterium]